MSEKKKIKRFLHDLGKALDRLKEVSAISLEENDLAIEATIQCFEFSFELFWKTLRELLQEEGIQANSPKRVLSEAYTQGWINEHDSWVALLDARNLTSHVYNEQKAREIYERIKAYAPMMQDEFAGLRKQFSHFLD